jgi:Zn-dependent peptidase ImmA (M78 family)/transcriptional regulator with XRE-family HTH domain
MNITEATIGRRLKEARLNSGLTQDEAAHEVGLPRTAVVNIEAGKRTISTLELSKFAFVYHRPVEFFYQEASPESVEPEDLILTRLSLASREAPTVKKAIARAVEYCREGIKLEGLLGRRPRTSPPIYDLPAPRRTEEAIEQGISIAEEERRRLGLGFAPIADTADLITTQGIWASGVQLPDEMSGLFIKHSSIRSVILVNYNHARPRKRFSYAHEYAHAILDRAMNLVVTTRENSQELIEKRANAFAAAFLMPQSGVYWFLGLLDKGGVSRLRLHDYGGGPNEEDVEVERRATPGSQRIIFKDVAMLAHHFGTSYESAVYRLRDLRVIRPTERQALLADDQIKAARDFIQLFHKENQDDRPKDRELVREVANLAIEAFQREEISAGYLRDLGKKLEISGAELVRLAETVTYE